MEQLRFVAEQQAIVIACRFPYPRYGSLGVCLARLNCDGRLELLSRGWEQLLGFHHDELDGMPFAALVGAEDEAFGELVHRLADPDVPDPVPLALRRKDGGSEAVQFYRRFDAFLPPSVFIVCVPRGQRP